MAIPHSRESLLIAAREQYDKLGELIDSLSPKEQAATFPFRTRERNIRDVLVHLGAWQQLYLDWSTQNMAGQAVSFLPKPYTWQNYGNLNDQLLAEHQSTSLADAKTALAESNSKIIAQVSGLINEQLFMKQQYAWTGRAALGDYINIVTVGNEAWAIKLIHQYKHELKHHQLAHA